MVKMHMKTNARIVSKVLTRNKNTFYALKELINNSIQANATSININPSHLKRRRAIGNIIKLSESKLLIMGKGSHIQNFLKVYWKLQQITSLTDLV